MHHLRFTLLAVAIAVGLFVGMLVFLELGRRLGLYQLERHGAESRGSVGIVDAAVYGLLGLLIGFTFSGAATRFDHRREIIGKELSTIGTAWRRIDLLPPDVQAAMRDRLRAYLDAVIASYSEQENFAEALVEPPALARAANDLWTKAVAAILAPSGEPARVLLVNSLNDMFVAVEEERLARRIHPPLVIFATLGIAALVSALFAGYAIANKAARNRFYMIGVAATISMAVYVIIELEYPRLGLIRVNDMDHALAEMRATMK